MSLMSEKPLEKITVTEIAERADIDRKTFYLHYDTIDALVDEVIHTEVQRIAQVLGEASFDESGDIDVSELFQILSAELATSFDERTAILRHTNTDRMIARLQPVLAKEIAEKDSMRLAEHLGPYLGMFTVFFCSGLLSMYRFWVGTESELPMENLAAMAGATVAGAIAHLTASAPQYVPQGGK